MKSTNEELEKKIDEILNDMDYLEINKEPLSKSFDSFLKYSEKTESMAGKKMKTFRNELKKSQFKYRNAMQYRIDEWKNISEEKFSKLLAEETGMPKEDINIIKKPFHLLRLKIGMLYEFADIFNEFNFDFLIKHRDTKLSVNKFFSRLRNNKCPELSALYDSSIDSLIKIMETQVMIASDEIINKRFLEEIFIPSRKKKEGYVNDEEMRQEFGNSVRLDENLCGINMFTGKKILAHNIMDIDSIYSGIRKEYNSLPEYIEKDMGLGARSFLF